MNKELIMKQQILNIIKDRTKIDICNPRLLLLRHDINAFIDLDIYTSLSFRKKVEFILNDSLDYINEPDEIKIFKKHLLRADGKINSPKLRNPIVKYFIKRLVDKHNFMADFTMSEKWFCLQNGITKKPLCFCGKQIKNFMNTKFCSHECAMTDELIRIKIGQSATGKKRSKIQCEKMSKSMLTRWSDVSYRDRVTKSMKIANKGNGRNFLKDGKPWNVGIPASKESIEKALATKKRNGVNMSGENNPQFGKSPSPKAGRGINGRYKNQWFRSSLELFYLLYFDLNDINFKSAETKEFQTVYFLNGVKHTYSPDLFIIDTNEIIEIKPKKRISEKVNILKMKSLQEKFNNYNCLFKTEEDIIDFIDTVTIKVILDIIDNKELVMEQKQIDRLIPNLKRIKYDARRNI